MIRPLVLLLTMGFVMPSYSILRRMAGQRDDLTLTTLKLDGIVAVSPAIARTVANDLGTSWTSGELSLSATVAMRFPGRCRIDVSAVESGKSASAVWNNTKRRTEGASIAGLQQALDEACALLVVHSGTEGESRGSLERHLGQLKVDTKQVSLARFSGLTAYVIGERKEGAQLWVYKDRFLPARVKMKDDSGTQWDIRFIDYTSQATSDWFPRVIEAYQGDELMVRLSILNADTRATLDPKLF